MSRSQADRYIQASQLRPKLAQILRIEECNQWMFLSYANAQRTTTLKEQRKQKIFDLWLAGWTQDEIADAESIPKGTVDTLCLKIPDLENSSKLDKATATRVCCDFPDLEKCNKLDKAAANHATDFETPIYNIWKPAR